MSDASVIYLDHNASTPVAPEAAAAMQEALAAWGNPSSTHAAGQSAKRLVSAARGEIARLLGASPAEIVFTSGATESNEFALRGVLATNPGKRHIVMSAVEHPSLMLAAQSLERHGVQVTRLCVDGEGQLDPADLAAAIRPDTALVSIMRANNETGVIFPLDSIAAITRAAGVPLHCDATQAAGRLPIDFATSGVDLMSLSAHKLYGPKGVGTLVVRKGQALAPLFHGHQERGRRGGTENVPGIVGFGAAARLAHERLADDATRIASLRQRFERELRQRIPQVQVAGSHAERLPNTTSVRFGVLDAELILNRFDRAGICASSGSACTAGGTEPSHVLLAMGCTREQALAAVRFSLGRQTTNAELDRVLDVLIETVSPKLDRAA